MSVPRAMITVFLSMIVCVLFVFFLRHSLVSPDSHDVRRVSLYLRTFSIS